MADPSIAPPSEPVRYWLEQIEGAQKWHRDWHERGKSVVKRYLDEKTPTGETSTAHKMNVLWSNVQTIQPALYAKSASPRVQRRFRDKDPVGRWAATVLERAEAFELDAYDDDYHYRASILDYLLPGRGQVWVYYEPKFEGTGAQQKLEWECAKVRHLHWRDFLTNPARTWDEVFWVAKCDYLTKEEATAQKLDVKDMTFSEQKEDDRPAGDAGPKTKKAAVWEIWDKTSGKINFVSKLSPKLLRAPQEPPVHFDGFFPCPRPLTTTTTTDSILPVPDFVQYQNQAAEIDRLSQKINLLTKALRVAGVYDASSDALGKLLDDTNDNIMLPVESWAAFFGTHGIEGSVSFLPLKEIVAALQQCYLSREQAKASMYEITGISDIVRGASDPNETATAQNIKSQWGSLRIRDRQKEVQRFIRDVMRLKAEIHAEVFSPETLKTMSNVPLATEAEKQQLQQRQQIAQQLQQAAAANPQEAQQIAQAQPQLAQMAKPLSLDEMQRLSEPSWEQVMQLLKDEKLRGYRIDIETDSTINADETEEKQSRTEFLAAMTTFIQAWGPIVLQQPKFAPLAGEMMTFGARAFKAADSLETAIQEAVDSLSQQALLPQPQQPPDPKMQLAQQQSQHEQQMQAGQMQLEQEKQAHERGKMAHEQQMQAAEADMKGEELAHRHAELQTKTQADLQGRQIDAQKETSVAEASRLKPEDLSVVADTLGKGLTDIAKAMEKSEAQSQANIERSNQALERVLGEIAHLASAPKKISVNRDKSGKIIGGISEPAAGNA